MQKQILTAPFDMMNGYAQIISLGVVYDMLTRYQV
jgi:hypothetical protein